MLFLRGAVALQVVEWRLFVGCGKAGFFTEFLGFAAALRDALRERNVDFVLTGVQCNATDRSRLFPEESRAVLELMGRPRKVEPTQHLVIEHGAHCRTRKPDVARLMVERAYDKGRDAIVYACAKRARSVWVPTEWAAEQFRAAGAERVQIVPEAVDPDLFRPVVKKESHNSFTILTMAKWAYRKNLDTLLEALFAHLPDDDQDYSGVVLLLQSYVPSWDHRSKRNLQKVADDRRETYCRGPVEKCPRVEWTGALDRDREGIKELYERADVFVLPTLGEGWGLPIHEAMSMGLPVICTNHSGPAALVGDAGILLPSHGEDPDTGYANGPTPAEIGIALRSVMRDPEHARQLGDAARTHVSTHFSPRAVASIILQRLEDVLLDDHVPTAYDHALISRPDASDQEAAMRARITARLASRNASSLHHHLRNASAAAILRRNRTRTALRVRRDIRKKNLSQRGAPMKNHTIHPIYRRGPSSLKKTPVVARKHSVSEA